MLEIPEAITVAKQINKTLKGKRVQSVVPASSYHKLMWFSGEPSEYHALLQGKTIGNTYAYGGRVEIEAGDMALHFCDGINLRFYDKGDKLPPKYQMLFQFDNETSLVCTVAMYGGIQCCKKGELDDFYSTAAREKPAVLSDTFDRDYFFSLFDEKALKMSAKAFLATEQRIPGIGNGVVQDILLNAKIHPKRKMNTLDNGQKEQLFHSIKNTLSEMVSGGGRDTEKDLFGNPGRYKTKLSKTNKLLICPVCGGTVRKESYMGGSVYYCDNCQEELKKS